MPAESFARQATFLLLFFMTCGFVINKNQIPGGWNGVFWANPMQVKHSVQAVAAGRCAGLSKTLLACLVTACQLAGGTSVRALGALVASPY